LTCVAAGDIHIYICNSYLATASTPAVKASDICAAVGALDKLKPERHAPTAEKKIA